MSFDRALRTFHGWLGLLVMPWVVLAGLTGLVENHTDLVVRHLPMAAIPTEAVMASRLDAPLRPVDATAASEMADRLLSGGHG